MPDPLIPVGRRPGKKRGKSSQGANAQSDGATSDATGDSADTDGDDNGSGQSGSDSQSGGSPDSSMLSDNGSPSPRHANGSKLSAMSTTPNRQSKSSRDDANKKLEPEMLAGRRWGFSEPGASIGFEREVRIDVSEDKLVIAEKYTVPIGADESKQEIFEKLATSLDRYSHEWGRPPQGFFWTPRLKFVVKPEANANYEQLNALMTRAGMATSHEFAKDPTKIQFGREGLSTPTKPPAKTANKQFSEGIR